MKLEGAQCPPPGPDIWQVAGKGSWQAIFGQGIAVHDFVIWASTLLYSSSSVEFEALAGTAHPHSVATVSVHC
ncbi:MAG TPA: hypothetical protein VFQ35_18815 [Polyangiaceae bacterium]|nr:hypothetical protein [Polyangiaceae bacterium]